MAKTYKTYLPEQDLLLPPSLRDWLPENHLAYCVSDVVDQLDLSAIESVYEEEDRGQPPYHPRMMAKILAGCGKIVLSQVGLSHSGVFERLRRDFSCYQAPERSVSAPFKDTTARTDYVGTTLRIRFRMRTRL